jgi:hypothetical protein
MKIIYINLITFLITIIISLLKAEESEDHNESEDHHESEHHESGHHESKAPTNAESN